MIEFDVEEAVNLSTAQQAMLLQANDAPYGEVCPHGQRRRTAATLEQRGLLELLAPVGYRITSEGRLLADLLRGP